ncbi:Rossmann-like and DUF2520 domain-containing protein [Anaerostipes sp.]|uniref:Rossmann-like and DUF2520 domain-containing protein n=1 Tax=Anaerostipes sp. TaxID=1872530 RepID=UPI0025BD5F2E|nr:Rossmann-like and DUF2520 domain-containing protein [Anaerostipes sp.]MBS7008991.1 DUF2520 domain-containing protein [Anaerostipes sp.]
MKAGFIGAGKAGCSLGRYFVHYGIPLAGYASRSEASARLAAKAAHTQSFDTFDKLLSKCDVLFITVPDSQIQGVWEQLRAFPVREKFICHCSGSLSSAIFSDITEAGAYGYSIHPMFPFNSKTTSYEDLKEALFTLEGDEAHKDQLLSFLSVLPNRIVEIAAEKKVRYHAAAVMASNQMAALISQALGLLESCGFTEQEGLLALAPLARQNLENILAAGPREALTGPVERNDAATVEKHLKALSGKEKQIYVPLCRELIRIAENRHPSRSYEHMERILEEEH